MKTPFRRLPAVVLLACALAVSACAGDPVADSGTTEASATATTASPTTAAPSSPAESPSPAVPQPSASSPASDEETPVALTQTFTSPNGSLSFRYPEDWTVTVPEGSPTEFSQWALLDAAGEAVLTLTVRPDEDMYKVSPPLTPLVIPQGQIPGAVDQFGTPTVAAVAATPGQSRGGSAGILYGMTSATGADPVFGDIRWGNGYLLSFTGHQMLGPNDQVDMAAEVETFAASTRFRTQILPVLQSLTAAPGTESDGESGTSDSAAGASCAGVQYTYENLQGITCDEAKAILQVVSDTGEPIGARGQRTPEYHCFWSSAGERDAGLADVICRDRIDGTDLFEANYR